MEFAISGTRAPDFIAFAREVERLGFDYVATGEHIFFHGPVPNAFINLAAAAAATSRIKLLSAITLFPVYPPALLAKLAAQLDYLSGGRFHLGAGVGGEFPKEFEAVGVPVKERGARTDEALEVVRKLLTGERVTFDGRFTKLSEVQLMPAPVQKPLPIWVAGRKEAAMRRVARFGDVWLPYMYSPERLARSLEAIRDFAGEAGRDPSDITPAIYLYTTVYPDEAKAKRIAAEIVGGNYQQDFSYMVDRYMLAGTPESCRRRLQEYIDAGAQKVVIQLGCPPEDLEAMLPRVAEEVVAAFR